MLFLWLIDWLTPPSLVPSLQGLPGSLAGLFATDDGLSDLLHQASGVPGCQLCSVFAVLHRRRSPALGGHIRSPTRDCLMAEVESSRVGFSMTGTKVGTEPSQGKGVTRQLLRLSLPLLLGGHGVRGLVGPSDRPPWESVSCPGGISPFCSTLAGPAKCDCPLSSMSSRNSRIKFN